MATLQTYNGYPLWHYIPSLPASIVFAVIFGLLTGGHLYRMIQHRMWFCIPFVVGGLFEIVGYIGRAMAHDKTGELIPYVLQSTLLLLAPVLFAASLYMTLSRIILAVDGGRFSYIRPRWLTRIFVAGDAFTFLVQASGAGLRVKAGSGDSDTDPNLGTNIIVGGLILQIVVFGIFIVVGVSFNRRFRRDQSAIMTAIDVPWQQSLIMVYVASIFIMVRNIFRVAEYAMGNDGYLLSVEWGVYVFDASLMTLTMAWFLWRYPNQLRRSLRTSESGSGGDHELAERK